MFESKKQIVQALKHTFLSSLCIRPLSWCIVSFTIIYNLFLLPYPRKKKWIEYVVVRESSFCALFFVALPFCVSSIHPMYFSALFILS